MHIRGGGIHFDDVAPLASACRHLLSTPAPVWRLFSKLFQFLQYRICYVRY